MQILQLAKCCDKGVEPNLIGLQFLKIRSGIASGPVFFHVTGGFLGVFSGNVILFVTCFLALQRTNTGNWKQIFPEKKLHGHSPNFHIHVSVSNLYIPTIDLPNLFKEICGPTLGV
jgi:hypothetical protein